MKFLQPVVWSKGTFLAPQHLQVQDRYVEDILQFRMQALNYRAWGFQELVIDEDELAGGRFKISRASGILPDGLLFDIPDSDPGPASKSLEDLLTGDRDSIDLYLTISDHRARGINVSVHSDAATRYIAETSLFRDENAAATEKPVQLARKNFRILADIESREGLVCLQTARVQRTSTGNYKLDPKFVPPLINFAASPYLQTLLRGIVEILSARSSILAGSRRQKNQHLADFTATDIASFWLLYTINAHFPVLHHWFSTLKAHPSELFSEMAALAGALTTFSMKIHPRDLPLYDHDNLGECFTKLDTTLRTLLETVVPTNIISLALKESQPSIYSTALDDDKYMNGTRLYLAISADCGKADLMRRVPAIVKACSATHMDELVKRALPGMSLVHVPSPPSAIPLKLNYEYFSIGTTGAAWESVRRARNFAAYVPNEIPNPDMELIILLPQAQ